MQQQACRTVSRCLAISILSAVIARSAPAAETPATGAPPRITIALDLGKLTIEEGAAIPLTAILDVKDANLVYRTAVVTVGTRFLRPEEKDPGIPGIPLSLGTDDWRDAKRLGLRWSRLSTAMIHAKGRLILSFGTPPAANEVAGLAVHAPAGTGRLLVCALVGVPLPGNPEITYMSYTYTVVNVSKNEKTLKILDFDVVGGRTVKVGERFAIRLEFELGGGDGAGTKTDATIKATLRRKNPPAGQPAGEVTKTGTMRVATPNVGGSTSAVKEFGGTCNSPGECELEVEVTAPGYPKATRSIPVQAKADEAPTQVPVGTPAKQRWIRSAAPKYLYNNTSNDAPPSRSGPYWTMGVSANSMTYSEKVPDETGKEKTYSATVQWSEPPAVIVEGEAFPLSMSASPRDGAHVLGGIHASRGDFVFSDPYAAGVSNYEAPEKGQTTIQVKPQFDGNNEDVMIGFSATPRRVNADPAVYGAWVQWQYTQAPAGATAAGAAGGGGPNALSFAAEQPAPLEAWLEPMTVEVTPRSGLYSPVDLWIRGAKPNSAAVEVDYATTDAWGTLVLERHLKVEGKGKVETGDLWLVNEGGYRWGLKVGANLGIAYGDYHLPITVRQPGHGAVRLCLTIRVLPRGRASGGHTGPGIPVSYGQSGTLEVRLERPALNVAAGGLSESDRIFVRGVDTARGEPIEVVFPQMAQDGALPGGILVDPGSRKVSPADLWPVDVLQKGGWLPIPQGYRAKSDAPSGVSMIDIVVRQRNVGEVRLAAQVAVLRSGRPVPPAGPLTLPPAQPGPITVRTEPAAILLRRGETGLQAALYFRGWRGDVSDRVEIELPQVDANGNTPDGLVVSPPSFSCSPGDLRRDTPVGDAMQQFSIGVRGDAQPGIRTLLFRVRQGRHGEATVALTVTVEANAGGTGGRPPVVVPPPPGADPAKAAAAVAQGKALFAKGDLQGALAAFEQAVQAHPDGVEGRDGRMLVRFWLQDFAGAAEDGRVIARLQPDNLAVRRFLALLALAQGLADDADAELDRLEPRLPDNGQGDADFQLLRGQVQVALGMGGQADETFRRVIALDPQRTEKLYTDGTEMLKRGLSDLGALELRTVLRLDPRHANAWWALGDAHERSGRNAEAIEAFRKYVALSPVGPWADAARQRLTALEAAPPPAIR